LTALDGDGGEAAFSRVGTRLANGSDGWRRFDTLRDCRGRTLVLVGFERTQQLHQEPRPANRFREYRFHVAETHDGNSGIYFPYESRLNQERARVHRH
jgi:hypothetical protein